MVWSSLARAILNRLNRGSSLPIFVSLIPICELLLPTYYINNQNVNKKFTTFGEALSFAIDYNRLSQSDFSEKWGKDRGQVSKYVNNIMKPRPRSIKEIEGLLSVRFRKSEEGYSLIWSKCALRLSRSHFIESKCTSDIKSRGSLRPSTLKTCEFLAAFVSITGYLRSLQKLREPQSVLLFVACAFEKLA